MTAYNVAVAGALGLEGSTMVRILEEFDFPVGEPRLLERRDLAGAPVSFRGAPMNTIEAGEEAFAGIDLVLFATNEDVSRDLVPMAVRQGGRSARSPPRHRAAGPDGSSSCCARCTAGPSGTSPT